MRKTYGWSALRAVLVLAIGIGCFGTFIHINDFERGHLSALVVTDLQIPGITNKTGYENSVEPTLTEFTALKTAYDKDPSETGAFNIYHHGADSGSSQALITNTGLLPTASDAKTVESEMNSEFLAPSVLTGEHATTNTPLSIPAIPGVIARHIHLAKSTSAAAADTNIVIFRYDRVAFAEVYTADSGGQQVAITLAERNYDLIKQNEPSFSFTVSSKPVALTIFYFLAVVALAVFAFGGPAWMAEQQVRQAARQEARTRYHYQVRGAKVLKGQRSRAGRR